ncbi:F-box/kelch-repeat protein At5g26960 [Silene latifolia]|uniref:F-box/kelch-repeat protein At5g26960 n=1 Tax=Silene latifolia TaxID=37657 RepID=UPI003D77D37F
MTVREMTGFANVRQQRDRDNCNSRHHFSRLMKSCCPNPNTPNSFIPPNPIVSKPKLSNSFTSIHGLPDDILYEILSRIPLSSLASASAVCRRWAQLLDSHSFSLLRRRHAVLHPTLFAFSLVNTASFCTLRLFQDDAWNRNTPRNDVVLMNIPSDILADISHARLTVIGRKVFIVARSSSLIFDPWTGLVKTRSGPVFPRKRFAIASVNGKAYVAGGSTYDSAVEEYDPDADTWSVITDAPRKRYGCIGVGINGVFYIIGGLKIGTTCGALDTRATVSGAEARVYASSMDLYDVAARGWLRSRVVPGGGCVVAACGANGYLYVLASHAVELSFWRFNANRNGVGGGGGGGGGGFGEWCRIRAPPIPAQVRLGGRVKFSCVGVEEKVVLIQVMGSVDDLLRRSGRNVRGINNKHGIVFVFDCVTQEWSRGPNLPELVQRASCVCVDC